MYSETRHILFVIFWAAIVSLSISGVYVSFKEMKKDAYIQNNNKVVVGTLKDLNTISSFPDGDITTIVLTDGQVVALSGRINPWKAGDPVMKPAADPDGKVDTTKYWCVSNQCLQQE